MPKETYHRIENNIMIPRKGVYTLGFIATLIVVIGTIIDIIAGIVFGGDLSQVPQTTVERFNQFQQSTLLGLYNLDMLNLITSVIMIPTYYALYAAQRHLNSDTVKFALLIFIIASAVFIANNTALAMLDLSHKYFETSSDTQKALYAAAGEAMLARGAHGSSGAFTGFVLSTLASIVMSFGMLKGKVFSEPAAYCGIIGGILLLLYLVIVTFVQNAQESVMIISAPGGILSLIWMILVTLKFFKLRCQMGRGQTR